jgi:PBP1b-binding outer membrane lipoprotein LpoB
MKMLSAEIVNEKVSSKQLKKIIEKLVSVLVTETNGNLCITEAVKPNVTLKYYHLAEKN